MLVDPNTGEVLPDLEDFIYHEVGWGDEVNFKRNEVVDTPGIIKWRTKYNNTGVYRSLYSSNTNQMVKESDNEETLYYGNLCFDMDGPKESFENIWTDLVVEIEEKLVPRLKVDFGISETDIHIWFSGGRGFHVEVPAQIIGVWPKHDLPRINGKYARQLRDDLNLQFFDASLYGNKRLYRMEYSKHQRSGLYKQPIRFAELAAVRDDYSWMKKFATKPRNKRPSDLFTTHTPSSKSLGFYAMLVREFSTEGKVVSLPVSVDTIRDRRKKYNRTYFKCVETMMSQDYLLNSGSRNTMGFFFSRHLRDAGFTYDEAYLEMKDWAHNHCDPPMTSKLENLEWEGILDRAYRDGSPGGGCTYIQNHFPSLCVGEENCPIGLLRLNRK